MFTIGERSPLIGNVGLTMETFGVLIFYTMFVGLPFGLDGVITSRTSTRADINNIVKKL